MDQQRLELTEALIRHTITTAADSQRPAIESLLEKIPHDQHSRRSVLEALKGSVDFQRGLLASLAELHKQRGGSETTETSQCPVSYLDFEVRAIS